MRIAIIGRSELMYNTMTLLNDSGHKVSLVITSKEAPEYRYKSIDFQNYANEIGAQFIHKPKIEATDLNQLKEINEGIDIALSINYSGIISGEVINLFRLGILNAHAGDLPRYRGNAPIAWAILQAEEKIGLCVHKMVGGELDSGGIIMRKYYPINIETRIGEIFSCVNRDIPLMMLEAVRRLQENPDYILEKQSKDPFKALRCYPRLPEDGKINWENSNEQILRLINSLSEPFSGAFGNLENIKIIIWRAKLYSDSEIYLAAPGQVSKIKRNGDIIVITGYGKLLLKEVEIEGKRGKPGLFIKSIRKRLS